MKTVKFMMALAAAATLASCGGQAPKANLQNDIDSLSYAIGRTLSAWHAPKVWINS